MKFLFRKHDVIKIPGKSFEDLSMEEVGWMIEADSSLSPNGNEFFSSCALDEFLHNIEPKRADLKNIQQKILNNIYINIEGSKDKRINTEFLTQFALQLKGDKTDRQE